MSQESPQLIGGFRADLSSCDERAAGHRSPDEPLLVRFPAVYPYVGRFWSRLPPRSRLRRMMLSRGVPRTCAALNRRDFAAFLVGIHPGIEFRGTRDVFGPDQTEAAHGHTGVLEFLQAWFDAIDEAALDFSPYLKLPRALSRMSKRFAGTSPARWDSPWDIDFALGPPPAAKPGCSESRPRT